MGPGCLSLSLLSITETRGVPSAGAFSSALRPRSGGLSLPPPTAQPTTLPSHPYSTTRHATCQPPQYTTHPYLPMTYINGLRCPGNREYTSFLDKHKLVTHCRTVSYVSQLPLTLSNHRFLLLTT